MDYVVKQLTVHDLKALLKQYSDDTPIYISNDTDKDTDAYAAVSITDDKLDGKPLIIISGGITD